MMYMEGTPSGATPSMENLAMRLTKTPAPTTSLVPMDATTLREEVSRWTMAQTMYTDLGIGSKSVRTHGLSCEDSDELSFTLYTRKWGFQVFYAKRTADCADAPWAVEIGCTGFSDRPVDEIAEWAAFLTTSAAFAKRLEQFLNHICCGTKA